MNANSGRHPLVSIIMVVKNGMPHVVQALESLSQQSYRNFELVVQDGVSRDQTLAVIESARNIPEIRVDSRPDTGIAQAWNRAVARCRGMIIGSMDADNMLMPTSIECAVEVFSTHPQTGAIYGAYSLIDADGKELITGHPGDWDIVDLLDCTLVPPFATAYFSQPLCGNSLYVEDEKLRTCPDFAVWLNVCQLPIRAVRTVLARHRAGPASRTETPANYDQFCNDKLSALERFFQKEGNTRIDESLHDHSRAGIYLWAAESVYPKEGRSDRFMRYCEQAYRLNPRSQRLRTLLARSQASTE